MLPIARLLFYDTVVLHSPAQAQALSLAAPCAPRRAVPPPAVRINNTHGDQRKPRDTQMSTKYRNILSMSESLDSLATLDAVDWASVSHAYGPATDVPDQLRTLASPDITPDELANFYLTFYSNIYHQGSRYSASAAAVPFLIALLNPPATVSRERILGLLVNLAVGHPRILLDGFDVFGPRERLVQVQAPGWVEEQQ
ncbi:hypothetical protein GGX14DRAFT_554514 [Mycena pura]|uniref:Uncharacterized protein n=1 Tax=Mycena pura TaxID=153505 RepID=A0AAD7E4G6_9AGAR|nr:hypothetical protein GGX14DRAFT_554514 [Mycena pura]